MAKIEGNIVSRVKQYRQQANLSQSQLAELVGFKRQAIYDIESGRYLPNTGVALRLARILGCRVEDLFSEKQGTESPSVIMADKHLPPNTRVSVVKIRDRLIGYPVDGVFSLNEELRPADGVLEGGSDHVRLFGGESTIAKSILLMGCDPAFSLLAAHVSRSNPNLRMLCRFASSYAALDNLAAGKTHIAGTHLHNRSGKEANVMLARKKLAGTGGLVIGYSLMEEGFMVAPGNPIGIHSVADLAETKIRLINREPGAALRLLLDEKLVETGIPTAAVSGYDHEVYTHNQGAWMVACGAADTALGLRTIASAYGLDFVPIAEARCDLVIPSDLIQNTNVQIILDVIQSRGLRDEIAFLPGYSSNKTGNQIAEL